MEKTNSVSSLKSEPFHRRTPQEKLCLKELGPDQLDIIIKQQTQDREEKSDFFHGEFELALRGHDENEHSENPGIFMGLVDFVGSLNAAAHEHLQTATVFKGTFKTVQEELLDRMFSVVREQIIDEIKSADFVSILADETMNISTQCQLVIVVRYIGKALNVREKFFEFALVQNATADSIEQQQAKKRSKTSPDELQRLATDVR